MHKSGAVLFWFYDILKRSFYNVFFASKCLPSEPYRRKGAARHIIPTAWLYRRPIPCSGEEGSILHCSNYFYLPSRRVEEGGGVSTLWNMSDFDITSLSLDLQLLTLSFSIDIPINYAVVPFIRKGQEVQLLLHAANRTVPWPQTTTKRQ